MIRYSKIIGNNNACFEINNATIGFNRRQILKMISKIAKTVQHFAN